MKRRLTPDDYAVPAVIHTLGWIIFIIVMFVVFSP